MFNENYPLLPVSNLVQSLSSELGYYGLYYVIRLHSYSSGKLSELL